MAHGYSAIVIVMLVEGINRGELDIELYEYLDQEPGSCFKTQETADGLEKRIRIKEG